MTKRSHDVNEKGYLSCAICLFLIVAAFLFEFGNLLNYLWRKDLSFFSLLIKLSGLFNLSILRIFSPSKWEFFVNGKNMVIFFVVFCRANDTSEYTSEYLFGKVVFFLYQGFPHRHWRFIGQQGKGGDHLLFHCTTSTRLRTLRHLLATMHVRWLSHIFNCNGCVYQTATRCDLPPYRVTIWVIDWWCNVCLFTCWIDSRFCYSNWTLKTGGFKLDFDSHLFIRSEPTNQV